MSTIKDVAREANVVVSTVYNVLNNIGTQTEETKIKVLKACKKLKYIQKSNVKNPKVIVQKTIGVFIASIEGEYYSLFTQSIFKECVKQGYQIQIFINYESTSEEIYNTIINSGVVGGVVMNRHLKDEDIDKLKYSNIPIVFCDKVFKCINISSITTADYEGTCSAMEYLIMQGHKRIGFIHGEDVFDNQERFRAYTDIMKKYKLEINEKYIFRGYFREDIAYGQTMVLIRENEILPTAIFCSNDEMAAGCIRALNKYSINVPSDISIVGYDNNCRLEFFKPNITTIHSPIPDVGHKSVIELIRLIESEELQEGITKVLKGEFLVKESSTMNIT